MTSGTAMVEIPTFAARPRGLGSLALRRFLRNPLALVALALLLVILGAGALASVLAPQGWDAINLSPSVIHHAPELAGGHVFGTDWVGADMFVRTLYGIRTTEEVALAATLLATVAGVLLGSLAGYFGGWFDAFVMRVADLVSAYPAVVLTLAALVYFGQAYPHILILVFAGFMWAVVARVVRANVSTLRAHEFVEAARALGASDLPHPRPASASERERHRRRRRDVARRPDRADRRNRRVLRLRAAAPRSRPRSATSSPTSSSSSSGSATTLPSPASAGGRGSSPASCSS